MTKPLAAFDIECYMNYFLVMFRNIETGNTLHFELHDDCELDIEKVRAICSRYTLVGFNSNNYDLTILSYALAGATNKLLKRASDAIIVGGLKSWQVADQLGFKLVKPDTIDLIEVAPGKASLKIYGGRIHSRKMQDLPIEPSALITPEQRPLMRQYCGNDLETTINLYNTLREQIDLRITMSKEYGIDLRSKSDAQIAEAVIKSRVEEILKENITRPEVSSDTTFKYRVPDFIQFTTKQMQDVLAKVAGAEFHLAANGRPLTPDELDELQITIGQTTYRMGIGGLHSCESRAAHFADDDFILVDRDVASYYPAIILGQGLAPAHLGKPFLTVYKDIVDRRLAAKKAGNTVVANSLKITINGSFGKLGSKWSALYSPDLLIQVTITGQLSLLMLIEMLETNGIPVVSANTDGAVIKCPRSRVKMMDDIVALWEFATGFETEATRYKALYSRDVNNYVAVKEKAGYKAKGAYAPAGLQKNPQNEICTIAVAEYLMHGTPVEFTINECDDIRRFVTIRTVRGGAVKDGEYLGKAIRWYYGKGVQGAIHYQTNGNRVPRSEGAKPLMELPDALPTDIDYDWYIAEAKSILSQIGANSC